MKKTIKLAFSPCPNDTFIFDALVHQKIDTGSLNFEYDIADVEVLNRAAFNQKYDVSKLSFNALLHVLPFYVSLTYGAAFCDNFGPVVVMPAGKKITGTSHLTVAVPGLYTTAAMIFKKFFKARRLLPVHFTEIEDTVLQGKADIGVVIHENVFTFKQKKLDAFARLGQLWHNTYKLPVPLGCIAVKRDMPAELQTELNELIGKSIKYAMQNPDAAESFIKTHADNTSGEVIRRHIKTYVNDYSLHLSPEAKKAVAILRQSPNMPPHNSFHIFF